MDCRPAAVPKEGVQMAGKIVLVVEDLIFLSRIQETARRLGVPVETSDPAGLRKSLEIEVPRAIILDLNHRSGQALPILDWLKKKGAMTYVPVVGFLSHVQSDLAKAAREAGCDQVLARSAFSERLPQLLRELAAE
jgi:CheY-like chemotaxis protein